MHTEGRLRTEASSARQGLGTLRVQPGLGCGGLPGHPGPAGPAVEPPVFARGDGAPTWALLVGGGADQKLLAS